MDGGPAFPVAGCINEHVPAAPESFAIGDRVRHRDPKGLHCGSGVYPYAIVVSVEPFALASASGDMLWTVTIKPDDMIREGKADLLEIYSAVGRWAWTNRLNARTGASQ